MEYMNALHAGTRLEEYEIAGVLGQGGFGITYQAVDTHLHQVVALKEYLPAGLATRMPTRTVVPTSSANRELYEWGREKFADEGRTLARFNHPQVNRVHRFFEENGTAYLVLEYIAGETLGTLLHRQRRLSQAQVERLLSDVLSGLAEVHAAGYIHRDLKPGNLMVQPDGGTVILDFGAARQELGQRARGASSILAYTPGYAPIEQEARQGDQIGPWSDLYALGITAYRCVSGLAEQDVPVATQRLRTHSEPDLKPATQVGAGAYDERLLKAIDWAIEVQEKDRPQSIAEWREAFSDGQSAEATQPRSSTASPSPAPVATPLKQAAAANAARFSLVSKLALAVVGVAVLGTGLWMLGVPSSSTKPTVGTGQELVSGSSAEWERVQAVDTPAAYREFIGRYPGHPMTELAKERLAGLEEGSRPVEDQSDLPGDAAAEWERVQAVDTPVAYREFIGRYPGHPMTELAKERLAGLD